MGILNRVQVVFGPGIKANSLEMRNDNEKKKFQEGMLHQQKN